MSDSLENPRWMLGAENDPVASESYRGSRIQDPD